MLVRIQEERIDAIERVVTIVHDQITKYLTSDAICSHKDQPSCDSIILGSLIRGSVGIGIWPRPEAPYNGIKFTNLACQLEEMDVFDDCYDSRSSGHGVTKAIVASVQHLEDQFLGIHLDFFLPEKRNREM